MVTSIVLTENEAKIVEEKMEPLVIENVGAGKGHLSTVELLSCKVLGKVIKKVPIIERNKFLAAPIDVRRFQTMHNTEVDIYSILQSHQKEGLLIPKIFDLKKMDITKTPVENGYIIMEHISNCSHVYLFDNLKPDDLIEPLRNLARLHALTYELTDKEIDIIPKDLISGWCGELFCEANMKQFMLIWDNHLKSMVCDEAAANCDLLFEVFATDNVQKYNDDCKLNGLPEFLCHGDFWPANLLFSTDNDGSRRLHAVVDFQLANMGNGAQDLTRLMAAALSGKDRREHYKRLLQVYYDQLVKAVGEAPFSFDTLLDSYHRYFPLNAALICTPTPARFFMNLAAIENEEKKIQYRDRNIEKYECLMVDLGRIWRVDN